MALHCKAEDIPNRQVVRSGEQSVGSMIVNAPTATSVA